MARRRYLAQLAAWPLAALLPASAVAATRGAPLKILIKSVWGSDDPTKAAFPFSHGLALAEAGHQVQIYLLGEAVVLMRRSVAEATTPVGWPPVAEALGQDGAAEDQVRRHERHDHNNREAPCKHTGSTPCGPS